MFVDLARRILYMLILLWVELGGRLLADRPAPGSSPVSGRPATSRTRRSGCWGRRGSCTDRSLIRAGASPSTTRWASSSSGTGPWPEAQLEHMEGGRRVPATLLADPEWVSVRPPHPGCTGALQAAIDFADALRERFQVTSATVAQAHVEFRRVAAAC